MTVAAILIILIIIIYGVNNRVQIVGNINNSQQYFNQKELRFLGITTILLIGTSVLRGDFSTDYKLYYYVFRGTENMRLMEVFHSRDWLFELLHWISNHIFHNYQIVILVAGLVTVGMYCKTIKEYSVNYLLSIALLIAVDNYCVSFNIIRNIMAAAICLFAMKYIYEDHVWTYFLWVFIASGIHRSALIMIPMYWILKIDYRRKKNVILLFATGIAIAICFFYTEKTIFFVQDIIGMNIREYYHNATYELTVGWGNNTTSALKTSALFAFVVFFCKGINYEDIKERCWFNACAVAFLSQMISIKFTAFLRIGYYFSGCFMLMIPLILTRIKNGKRLVPWMIVLLLIYCIWIQNGITDYCFFWQNQVVKVLG